MAGRFGLGPPIAGVMGYAMSGYDDEEDMAREAASAQEPPLTPYLALDRLLRYARSEALSQHRAKAASLIEAAIISLHDTTVLSKH